MLSLRPPSICNASLTPMVYKVPSRFYKVTVLSLSLFRLIDFRPTHQSLSSVTPFQTSSLGVPNSLKMCSSCCNSQSPGNSGCCMGMGCMGKGV